MRRGGFTVYFGLIYAITPSGWKLTLNGRCTHMGTVGVPKCVCGAGGILAGLGGAGLWADSEQEKGNCLSQHMQQLWEVLISGQQSEAVFLKTRATYPLRAQNTHHHLPPGTIKWTKVHLMKINITENGKCGFCV